MTKDEMLAGATADEGFTLNTRAAKEADFASGKLEVLVQEKLKKLVLLKVEQIYTKKISTRNSKYIIKNN